LTGVQAGQVLEVTEQYLYGAIEVVAETGMKVGQTLWRGLRPSSLRAADTHFGHNILFRLLQREQFSLALKMGELECKIAKRNYSTPRNERSTKIILVNYAQAAKWLGDNARAAEIVNSADWSASSLDFSLAIKCLEGNWSSAAKIMQELGDASELIKIDSYYVWPIFREFRETSEFLQMFKTVFGKEFTDDPPPNDEKS